MLLVQSVLKRKMQWVNFFIKDNITEAVVWVKGVKEGVRCMGAKSAQCVSVGSAAQWVKAATLPLYR